MFRFAARKCRAEVQLLSRRAGLCELELYDEEQFRLDCKALRRYLQEAYSGARDHATRDSQLLDRSQQIHERLKQSDDNLIDCQYYLAVADMESAAEELQLFAAQLLIQARFEQYQKRRRSFLRDLQPLDESALPLLRLLDTVDDLIAKRMRDADSSGASLALRFATRSYRAFRRSETDPPRRKRLRLAFAQFQDDPECEAIADVGLKQLKKNRLELAEFLLQNLRRLWQENQSYQIEALPLPPADYALRAAGNLKTITTLLQRDEDKT